MYIDEPVDIFIRYMYLPITVISHVYVYIIHT